MENMTAKEMVEKFQAGTEFVPIVTVLEAIKERQKHKYTDHYWMKERLAKETVEELSNMGFEVEEYEDVHSPGPMIKVSWEHLVDNK